MTLELSLVLWLLVKHFICDFPLQAFPWQYRNKGTYGHPGGLAHSGIHVLGSGLVLWALAPAYLWLALADGLLHYHIDWAKLNINKRFGWGPLTSELFWVALGVDQLLHSLTYIWMVWMIAKS